MEGKGDFFPPILSIRKGFLGLPIIQVRKPLPLVNLAFMLSGSKPTGGQHDMTWDPCFQTEFFSGGYCSVLREITGGVLGVNGN